MSNFSAASAIRRSISSSSIPASAAASATNSPSLTPGISTGYWKPCISPRRARSSTSRPSNSAPARVALAHDLVALASAEDVAEGRLPGAIGSHQGMDLTEGQVEFDSLEDLAPARRRGEVRDREGGCHSGNST